MAQFFGLKNILGVGCAYITLKNELGVFHLVMCFGGRVDTQTVDINMYISTYIRTRIKWNQKV